MYIEIPERNCYLSRELDGYIAAIVYFGYYSTLYDIYDAIPATVMFYRF